MDSLIVHEVARIAGLAAAPFLVGWVGEQLWWRWRQAAIARESMPSRSISARANGSASSGRARR